MVRVHVCVQADRAKNAKQAIAVLPACVLASVLVGWQLPSLGLCQFPAYDVDLLRSRSCL